MKKGVVFFLSLFLLSFVSAQFFGGYNNFNNFSFSLTNFLDSPDAVLLALFFIISSFASFVLRKSNVFRDNYGNHNRGIIAVISFSISLIAVWAINRSNLDFEGIFSGFGISGSLFDIVIWALILAAAISIIWKLGAGIFFFILGLTLIGIVVFTDLIYSAGTALVVGVISSIVGLWLWRRSKRKAQGIAPQSAGLIGGYTQYGSGSPRSISYLTWVIILGFFMIILGLLLGIGIITVIGIISTLIGFILKFPARVLYGRQIR